MFDVIIIGNGPAGISASLYTARAGLKTLVVGRDSGALEKAGEIENYYGFEAPISGAQLSLNGNKQAERVGVEMVSGEVVDIRYEGFYVVKTKDSEYEASSVILATGLSRSTPKIDGLQTYDGHGVSYCAVCDGFFYRKKDVAVLGDGEYAVHEASELLHIVNSVVLLTNGGEPKVSLPENITVNTKKILKFTGDELLKQVEFDDGTALDISGVFIAVGIAGSTDFAKKLGAETNGNKIVVDGNMATNVPGLYAAGDCTGGLMQIAKAVYDGARAGTEVVKEFRLKKSKK